MIISDFNLESRLAKEGYESIIGIDEAGRGPLAGPVVACAARVRNFQILNNKSQTNSEPQKSKLKNYDQMWDLVRDSKTLSIIQREKVLGFIEDNFFTGIGICDHKTVDRMNILEASFLAMKKAIASLSRSIKDEAWKNKQKIILLDGNRKIPNFSSNQKAIPSGDKFVKSISAASIVAKVTRDRMMLEAHEQFPQYNFDKHKGYGTKLHFEMLKKHGPCKIHRQSFAPVVNLAKR